MPISPGATLPVEQSGANDISMIRIPLMIYLRNRVQLSLKTGRWRYTLPILSRWEHMPILLGGRLKPCVILSAMSAGGMGEVYRAHDPMLGRAVTIQVLRKAFAGDTE
jgi:hypothetical protein